MLATRSLSLLVGASAFFLTVNAQFGGFGGGGGDGGFGGGDFGGGDDDNNNGDDDNGGDNGGDDGGDNFGDFGGGDDNNGGGGSSVAAGASDFGGGDNGGASDFAAASASNFNNDDGGDDDGDDNGDDNGGGNTTLNPELIQQVDGQGDADAGEADSLTSDNNFIDFCEGKEISEGQQKEQGSCNVTPMGDMPSKDNIPSARFQAPFNGDTIQSNQDFDINMAINNLETGTFTKAAATYYAAPQQLNGEGQVIGHSHFVIEQTDGNDGPLDPLNFAFFKGVNAPAENGILTETVTGGLPAGNYRLSSINAAANHQPVLAPIAQHGSIDDVINFTVSDNAGGDDGGQCDDNGDDNGGDDNGDNGGFRNKKRDVHQVINGLTWNQRRALKRKEEYQERYRARQLGARAVALGPRKHGKKWFKPF